MNSSNERFLMTALASLVAQIITTVVSMLTGVVVFLIALLVVGQSFSHAVHASDWWGVLAGAVIAVLIWTLLVVLAVHPLLLRLFVRLLMHERISYVHALLATLAGLVGATLLWIVELAFGGITLGTGGWLMSIVATAYVLTRRSNPAEAGVTVPDQDAGPFTAQEPAKPHVP